MSEPVAVGIDIGGTRLRTAVVTAEGTVLQRQRRPTPANDGERLLATLEEEIAATPRGLPVGVGIAGLVSPEGEIRYGPNIGVRDLPLAAELERAVERRIAVLNDGSAAALGEQRAGAGRGCDELVLFTIGTGVGGGVVIGGRLLTGATGFAGELGHMIVADGGRRCPCGNHGCIEAYASGTAIGNLAAERLRRDDRASSLRDHDPVQGPHVTAAADAGDAVAQEILRETGHWLGVAIASCVNALDPARVLLGGGAAAALAPHALATVRDTAGERLIGQRFRSPPPIDLAVLGDDAGTVGAALYVADEPPPDRRGTDVGGMAP